jgi:hypothetical protein
MTFAATIRDGWLEWGAKNLQTIFGQRRNLLRPAVYRLLRDVVRFNTHAPRLAEGRPDLSLGGLIGALGLGDWFRRYYLLPMAGAIWSCPPRLMLEFPARSFIRFFVNHGLMSMTGQPQWYTVTGGAEEYVKRLTAPFAHAIRTDCAVERVTRSNGAVQVTDRTGETKTFDHVVFASHGDETLKLLADASAEERDLLGAFRYQANLAVLHKDISVMPRQRRCWSSWVYRSNGESDEAAISVSYWMNLLQGIDKNYPLFVTLNPQHPIPEEHVFDRHVFSHPVFDAAAMAAQPKLMALQGTRHTWFAGAHLRNGFHEDGLWSAVNVAQRLGAPIPWSVAPPPQTVTKPAAARARTGGMIGATSFSDVLSRVSE